jgi:hypothetical protein
MSSQFVIAATSVEAMQFNSNDPKKSKPRRTQGLDLIDRED